MAVGEWNSTSRVQSELVDRGERVPMQYLAGFFDGEGCFSATIPKDDEPVEFIVTVTTTVEREVREFERRFGGPVSKHEPENENHSTSWKWLVMGTKARTAAERLYPHLRGKKDQAEVLIDAIAHKRRNRGSGNAYPDSAIETMHKNGEKLRSMTSAQRLFAEEDDDGN